MPRYGEVYIVFFESLFPVGERFTLVCVVAKLARAGQARLFSWK